MNIREEIVDAVVREIVGPCPNSNYLDEDTGEEISCPICNQTDDCPHLLATIDKTFGEWARG